MSFSQTASALLCLCIFAALCGAAFETYRSPQMSLLLDATFICF